MASIDMENSNELASDDKTHEIESNEREKEENTENSTEYQSDLLHFDTVF